MTVVWPALRAGAVGLGVLLFAAGAGLAQELGTVRVGVLQFGTVNWELDTIEHHGLDAAEGFDLAVQGFGGDQATNIALQIVRSMKLPAGVGQDYRRFGGYHGRAR